MSDALLKVCPKCLMLAELSALRCGNCTHLFRARRPDPAAPGACREVCPAEASLALPASFDWVWAGVRTALLLAIAVLLGTSAALAGRADYTGLRCTCEIAGFCTGAGALFSGADFLAALSPRGRGPNESRGSRPTSLACVPSTR